MAAHMYSAEIPADLTANDIAFISHILDLILNSSILYSLLNGAHIFSILGDTYVSF